MELLESAEKSGKWPQQACTTMFFMIPKKCHESEADCADADVDTLVVSSEGTGSGEMATEVSS